jgi:hypothetical protein
VHTDVVVWHDVGRCLPDCSMRRPVAYTAWRHVCWFYSTIWGSAMQCHPEPPAAHMASCGAAGPMYCRMYKLYELRRYTLLYCLPSPGIAEVKLSTGALLLVHERRPACVTCQLLSLPGAQVGHCRDARMASVQQPGCGGSGQSCVS